MSGRPTVHAELAAAVIHAQEALRHLAEANRIANPVEQLLLVPLVRNAGDLQQRLQEFERAQAMSPRSAPLLGVAANG